MITATVNFHGTKKALRNVAKQLSAAGLQGLKRAATKKTGAPAKITAALLGGSLNLPPNALATTLRKARRRGARGVLVDSKKYARSWRATAKRVNSKTSRLKVWPGGSNEGVDNAMLGAYLHHGTRHHKPFPHLEQIEDIVLKEAQTFVVEEVRRVFGG